MRKIPAEAHRYRCPMPNLSVLLALAMSSVLAGQSFATVYVDKDAPPGGDGNSWGTAYQTIQAGIDDADALDEEVWVAEGVYDEQRVSVMHDPPVDTGSLVMKEGVHLYGGFSGMETERDQRQWDAHVTVIDGSSTRAGEQAYHVVVGADNATLDGFTITGANAVGIDWNDPKGHGGGMYNSGAAPTLTNCTFTDNVARYGAGICNRDSSSPTITNCTFVGNRALTDAGGMMNRDNCSPVVTNCTFLSNVSGHEGGAMNNNCSSPTVQHCIFAANSAGSGAGMFNYQNSPLVIDCIFEGNEAGFAGGGMYNAYKSSAFVTNCTLTDNSAGELGGGMANATGIHPAIPEWSPTVTNCIFAGNTAGNYGGAMNNHASLATVVNCTFEGNSAVSHGGGVCNNWHSSPTVTNCILWGDTPQEIWTDTDGTCNPVVAYCNVQGGYEGTGNIDAAPLFVDAANGDFHLLQASPCVDAGSYIEYFTSDFEGDPRGYDGTAEPRGDGSDYDIGADEYVPDTDGDGLKDSDELRDLDPGAPDVQNPFDPYDPDSTGDIFQDTPDGLPDGQNDYDGDGMSNADEFTFGYNPIDPGSWAEVPVLTVVGGIALAALAMAAYWRRRASKRIQTEHVSV